MPKAPVMTKEEAVKFDSFSQQNYMTVLSTTSVKGCQCDPYKDVFTYERWRAQNFQVQKGEKAICKIVVFISVEDKITKRKRTIPRHCAVFCKCQVKEIT